MRVPPIGRRAQRLEADRYRELARRASDVVLILDANARVQYMSPSADRLMGYREDEWLGREVLEIVHPDDLELTAGAFGRALERPGVNEPLEVRVRQGGNGWRWFEAVATNLLDDPAIGGVVICARDITERVEAHAALQCSEDRLSALLRHSGDVVAVVSADATLSYVSPSAPALFGYAYGSHLGRNVLDLVHPDDLARVLDALAARISTTEKRHPIQLRVAHADGCWRDIELVSSNLLDDPAVNGIVLNLRDVTALRRTERELAANSRRFEAMLANLSDLVSVVDAQGTMKYVSPAVERVVGRRAADRVNASIFEFVHPDDAEFAVSKLRDALVTPGLVAPYQVRLLHEDGTYRVFEVSGNNLLEDPAVRGIIVNSRDVTDRVAAETALLNSERLYRTIVETADEGIWMIDEYAVTTFANRRMAEMLGTTVDAMIGRDLVDYMDAEGRAITAKNLERRRAGIAERHDFKFRRSDGTTFWAMISTSPLTDPDGSYEGAIALVTDITDRRRTEAALRVAELEQHRQQSEIERHRLIAELARAQRLESLGRLAGGVAHDFNNLIGVILNYTTAIAKHIDKANPAAADLIQVQRAAENAADLTRKLLIFGRLDRGHPEIVDVNDLVVEAAELVERPFGTGIAIVTDLSAEDCLTRADRGQIQQLLMNLLVNARDALPDGGTITVTTEHEPIARPAQASRIMLSVTDDGVGMSSDIVQRAFEPFFTTKLPEHGSGLGLATVHAIVTGAGGDIAIDSQPGDGTTVRIRLPGLDRGSRPNDDANASSQDVVPRQ